MAQTPPARSHENGPDDAPPKSTRLAGAALLGAFVSATLVGAVYEHRIKDAPPICAQSSLVQVKPAHEGSADDPRFQVAGARGVVSDAEIIERASADPDALKQLAVQQARELSRLRNELATRNACAEREPAPAESP